MARPTFASRERTNEAGSRPGWSVAGVLRALRCPRGLVTLSWTDYFPQIFDDDLAARVRHPSEISFDPAAVAVPYRIPVRNKRFYVPGRLEDLVDYVSCVVACYDGIRTAWQTSGCEEDCGPPRLQELEQGSLGEEPWDSYWNAMHSRVNDLVAAGYPWVLNADVESCAESIDTTVLSKLLAECGSDPDAVRILDAMHQAWRDAGFAALPVFGTFGLLLRLYLLEVERTLREQGILFARVLDDFRILCRSPEEKDSMLEVLERALALRGLRLNEGKTFIYRPADNEAAARRWLARIRGKVKLGIARPVLVRSLRWEPARPAAFALLEVLNRKSAD